MFETFDLIVSTKLIKLKDKINLNRSYSLSLIDLIAN